MLHQSSQRSSVNEPMAKDLIDDELDPGENEIEVKIKSLEIDHTLPSIEEITKNMMDLADKNESEDILKEQLMKTSNKLEEIADVMTTESEDKNEGVKDDSIEPKTQDDSIGSEADDDLQTKDRESDVIEKCSENAGSSEENIESIQVLQKEIDKLLAPLSPDHEDKDKKQ